MGRVTGFAVDGGIEFHVANPHDAFQIGLLVMWWTAALGAAVHALLEGPEARSPLDATLGIPILALAALMTARWLFGQEVIRLQGNTLTVKFDTFGVGRVRRYELSEVRFLRVDQPWEHRLYGFQPCQHTLPGEYWPSGRPRLVAPVITFEYRGREHRFGLDLDRQSANDLVDILREGIRRARASLHSGSLR